MSDVLFGRNCQISIGVPGQPGVVFKDLRVVFKVEKSLSSCPNKSEIKIYNLARARRTLAEQKGLVAVLKAGYGVDQNGNPNLESIFAGNIARVITTQEGPDYVTALEAGDGEVAYRSSNFEQTFSAGSAIKDVFTGILGSLGLSAGDTSGVPAGNIISSLSLSGPARKQMDDLAARTGSEWSIQDQAVQFIVKGGTRNQTAILLTPQTGLITIPKRKKELKKDGLEITSLLQGKIKPGSLIRVETKSLTGTYRAQKVTHHGDTHGKEFFTIMECDIPAGGSLS